MPGSKNYYNILGISEDASIFDIEKAYQNKAQEHHPDRAKGNRREAEKRFHDVC
jgi:molecular chaperone DnaJ